jgi:hypothetical protein
LKHPIKLPFDGLVAADLMLRFIAAGIFLFPDTDHWHIEMGNP